MSKKVKRILIVSVLIILIILIYKIYKPNRFIYKKNNLKGLTISVCKSINNAYIYYDDFVITNLDEVKKLYMMLLKVPVKKISTSSEGGFYNTDPLMEFVFEFTNGRTQSVRYGFGNDIKFFISDPTKYDQIALYCKKENPKAIEIRNYVFNLLNHKWEQP